MIFRNNEYTASNIFAYLILFLWMQRTVVECYEFDCSKGCSLNPLLNGIAVCGVDDVTYENICLAICQKVEIKKAGPCGVRFWNVTQNDRTGFVPIEIITRFASAGFKMTRRLNTTLFNRTLVREEPILNETDGTTGTVNQAVRLTHDGYEYYTQVNVTLPGSDGKTYGPQPPTSTRRSLRDRFLTVIGEDTRTRVNPTTGFPNSTIVAINYEDNYVAWCSGIVIAPDAVLTAGHCVYANGGWSGHTDIAPALNGEIRRGKYVEPFGRWNVSQITTYSEWQSRSNTNYDLAVVRYFPNEQGQQVGDVVGFAGVASISSSTVSSNDNLQKSTIIGYPGDHDYEMWTTGICSSGFSTRTTSQYKLFYGCDTVGGMSGSGILGPDVVVRGTHTNGGSSNSGTGLFDNSPHYQNVLLWSGLKQEGGNIVVCPCARWRLICRFLHRRQCKHYWK